MSRKRLSQTDVRSEVRQQESNRCLQKQGLVEVAKKKDFYGDEVDALVMEKAVTD